MLRYGNQKINRYKLLIIYEYQSYNNSFCCYNFLFYQNIGNESFNETCSTIIVKLYITSGKKVDTYGFIKLKEMHVSTSQYHYNPNNCFFLISNSS